MNKLILLLLAIVIGFSTQAQDKFNASAWGLSFDRGNWIIKKQESENILLKENLTPGQRNALLKKESFVVLAELTHEPPKKKKKKNPYVAVAFSVQQCTAPNAESFVADRKKIATEAANTFYGGKFKFPPSRTKLRGQAAVYYSVPSEYEINNKKVPVVIKNWVIYMGDFFIEMSITTGPDYDFHDEFEALLLSIDLD